MANPRRVDRLDWRTVTGFASAACIILPIPVIAFVVSLATITGSFSTAIADSVEPQSDVLKVKPDKCISLRQGLVCYQRVRFEWSLQEVGDYCLIEESAVSPIICWSQLQSGSYLTEFASRENKNYYLINQADQRKLGNVTVEMAWVYHGKKRSRGRWRLF